MKIIAILGLIIAIIALFAEIATQEFRCFLGLDICSVSEPAKVPEAPPTEASQKAEPIEEPVQPPNFVVEPSSAPIMEVPPPPPVQIPTSLIQNGNINFTAFLNPAQDMFETIPQFQARRHSLLQQFNQAAQQRDLRFKAGVAILKQYDADNQMFSVRLKWQAKWVRRFLGVLPKFAEVKIPTNYAQALYKAGTQKPLFVTVQRDENRLKSQGVLVEYGKAWTFNLLPLPKMVNIPAGKFQMGSNDDETEKPIHWVSIKRFKMSRYEITFEEYDAFAEATGRNKPNDEGWGRGNRPVIHVSWHDAVAYTQWLSKKTGRAYRLPTEAEWEYVARAGTKTDYWWGNHAGKNNANCDGCGSQWDNKQTAPVGSFKPNPFGLYDTAGNVDEWVADKWHENYHGAPTDGSAWNRNAIGNDQILRGGSWNFSSNSSHAADRSWLLPDVQKHYIGFRVVCVV